MRGSEIALLVSHINFDSTTAQNSGGVLLFDVCRYMADFVSVQPVEHNEVRAVSASSSGGRHPLDGSHHPTLPYRTFSRRERSANWSTP
jgi:hypothetical protein